MKKNKKKNKYTKKETETDTDELDEEVIPDKKKKKKDNKKNTKTSDPIESNNSKQVTESNRFKIPELIKEAVASSTNSFSQVLAI